MDGRKVQDYLWQDCSLLHMDFDPALWAGVFQKRVNKISQIKIDNPEYRVELRKRILQQAALSVMALKILDSGREIALPEAV